LFVDEEDCEEMGVLMYECFKSFFFVFSLFFGWKKLPFPCAEAPETSDFLKEFPLGATHSVDPHP
jgi:hypothetical protein